MSSGDKGQVGTESPRPLRKRRTRMANDKRIADDEFMAAAIGDVEWLRQSLREQKGKINFDKNVSVSLQGGEKGTIPWMFTTRISSVFYICSRDLIGWLPRFLSFFILSGSFLI